MIVVAGPLQTTEASKLQEIVDQVKNGIQWFGRQISYGFTQYIIPGCKAVLSVIRTGIGIFGLAFTLGCTLLALANRRTASGWRYSIGVRICLYTLSIFAFIGAGAALTLGAGNVF